MILPNTTTTHICDDAESDVLELKTRPLPVSVLNIENKIRSNPFPWRGQFSPQLIDAMISEYAKDGDFLLDPFAGSGTVLYEAGRHGLEVFGSEVNPAAIKLAQTYELINRTQDERLQILENATELLNQAIPLPLWSIQTKELFSEIAKKQLVAITKDAEGYVRGLLETLVVLLDFYSETLPPDFIFRKWHELRRLILGFPFSEKKINVELCDARNLPLQNGSVDLVITSPPYINVFNYHQQYRSSAQALGCDLLHVARSEIGSNRKHRGNRFLTVIQYCLDMHQVFLELSRVCDKAAHIIFVVGRESNVKKTPFFNSEIVEHIGNRCAGFKLMMKQSRVFKNKFGTLIYEDILHFTVASQSPTDTPKFVAKRVLEEAKARCPDESRYDLEVALSEIENVKPSPLYS